MKVQREGHMGRIENKRLERKVGDESSGSAEFSGVREKGKLLRLGNKFVLLDFQLLDF
jgi:hypothetical protein